MAVREPLRPLLNLLFGREKQFGSPYRKKSIIVLSQKDHEETSFSHISYTAERNGDVRGGLRSIYMQWFLNGEPYSFG